MKNQTDKLYNLDIWVYNRIKFFSDKDLECFESNDSMAELFGRHKNRVSSSISKLLRLNYITNNGKSQFDRRLRITDKEINICGVSINKSGVSINNLSIEEITRMLTGINKSGVEKLTKAVLTVNKNGDIYKYLHEYYTKSNIKEEIYKEKFDLFYSSYPIKKSRKKAEQKLTYLLSKSKDYNKLFDEIMKGLENYKKEIEVKKTESKYIKHPDTWLNKESWGDEYEVNLESKNSNFSLKYL